MADDLVLEPLQGFGLATVMARKDGAARLAAIIGAIPPQEPGWTEIGGTRWIGTGPEGWLAWRDGADAEWVAHLKSSLAGAASVSDQSGGYIMYRLAGNRARTLLQRGAFIDFHPEVFHTGSAAAAVIAHIGVIVWQTDAAEFHVALFRSFASSFEHWFLEASAAS